MKEPLGEVGFCDRNFGALFTGPAAANITYIDVSYTSCHTNNEVLYKQTRTGLTAKRVIRTRVKNGRGRRKEISN